MKFEYPSPEDCPDIANHTQGPSGSYVAWHEWAERMAQTHRQSRCPTCGYYAIWTPKETSS